jgi:hypothetical protein
MGWAGTRDLSYLDIHFVWMACPGRFGGLRSGSSEPQEKAQTLSELAGTEMSKQGSNK